MRVLGLVQRFGSGLAIARRALRENGQDEPRFQVDANWVHCTVAAKSGAPGRARGGRDRRGPGLPRDRDGPGESNPGVMPAPVRG